MSWRQGVLLWLALVTLFGLLSFLYFYLGGLAEGGGEPWPRILLREMTGWITFGLLFFPLLFLVRRFPPRRGRWGRALLLYGSAIILLGAVHTTLMWGSRAWLYPLFGFGDYDYGILPLRYGMELAGQVQGFTFLIAGILAAEAFRRAREQELRAAQLETHLARAELHNLRWQLQPHFLFNALNTVSSTMYRDPAAADEMLDQLSTLLRASLKTVRTDEIPLAEEVAVLDAYLAILRARFDERLEIDLEIEPATRRALVPSMILQPLVENAVRHGGLERGSALRVAIRSRHGGERLHLEIEDDGPEWHGDGAEPIGTGVGLSSSRERLRLLYGDEQKLEAGNGADGGFRVRIELPFRSWEAA